MVDKAKVNTQNIVAHARKQMHQARMKTSEPGYISSSSFGAVKKVRVSKNDPSVKKLLELFN